MPTTKTHKLYKIAFSVEGTGQFPFDMLRYDRCVPMTENDSHVMSNANYSYMPRQVNLIMFSPNNSGPTEGRWKSFGWEVVGEKEILVY